MRRSPAIGWRSGLATITLVLIAAWFVTLFRREPRFEGRPATEWVKQLVRNQPAARRALRELGPAAVPALTRAVEEKQHRGSSWLSSLRPRLPSLLRRLVPGTTEAIVRGDRAVEVLFDLGTNAAPAVPVLIRENFHRDPWDFNFAHATLVKIGPAGAPQLVRVLQSSDPRERLAAARYLGLAGPDAAVAAPALANALLDSDPLVQTEAVSALALMGPAAGAALPALKRSLSDADPAYRLRVIESLWRIGRESESTAPILSSILADRSSPHRAHAAALLGLMGPAAARAMPALSNVLQEEFSYTRVKAEEAIAQIQISQGGASPPSQ